MTGKPISKIELESRWDGFKIPIEELPDGPILFNGKDNWFLTSKEYMKDYNSLFKWYDNAMMFGIKEADRIKEQEMKDNLEIYEALLKESTSTGDLQELYAFHFKDEYIEIETRTFRFMAPTDALNEVTTWFKPEEIEYVESVKYANYKIKMENKTNKDWEIVGDHQAPPIFQVEGTTIDARTSSIEVRGWNTMDLVSFGNYMVSDHRSAMIDQHPELLTEEDKMEAFRKVSDADLSNWRFLVNQNAAQIQDSMPTDDGTVQYAGTFGGSQEEIEEGE